MSLSSKGNENRLADRDFNENRINIAQFDGCHTVNIAHPSKEEDKRPLVKAQRKELNNIVADIAEAGEHEAFAVWQKVHAEIGVASIEDMTVNQYQAAVSFLHAMLERCKEKDANKALVGLLLRNSEESDLRQKLIHYCHINFGTGRLNNLTRSQLQLALSWLDKQCQDIPQTTAPPAGMRFSMVALLRTYPKEIWCIFILGFLLGAVIF